MESTVAFFRTEGCRYSPSAAIVTAVVVVDVDDDMMSTASVDVVGLYGRDWEPIDLVDNVEMREPREIFLDRELTGGPLDSWWFSFPLPSISLSLEADGRN